MTDQAEKAENATEDKVKPVSPLRAQRGTTPPALRISDAVVLAKKVNELAAGSASYDLFSQISGNTKTSSTFARKVSALRQYGIIEDRDNIVSLAELGNRIVIPRHEADDSLAIKEAFLRIDLLGKFFEKHRGKLLPEEQYLRNIFLQEFKVAREVVDQWVDHFRDALATAHLLYVRADGKTQVLDEPSKTLTTTTDQVSSLTTTVELPRSNQTDWSDAVPVALGPNKLAMLKLPETWNPRKDLKRLLRMIELSLTEDDDIEEDQP